MQFSSGGGVGRDGRIVLQGLHYGIHFLQHKIELNQIFFY